MIEITLSVPNAIAVVISVIGLSMTLAIGAYNIGRTERDRF